MGSVTPFAWLMEKLPCCLSGYVRCWDDAKPLPVTPAERIDCKRSRTQSPNGKVEVVAALPHDIADRDRTLSDAARSDTGSLAFREASSSSSLPLEATGRAARSGSASSEVEAPVLAELRSMCDLHPPYKIYDMDMYTDDTMLENLQRYYRCCFEHTSPYANMIVTTSNFSVWLKDKKINRHAKVIPALRIGSTGEGAGQKRTRVFFFDDNINLHLGGADTSEGICNLRDVDTGEFVDFTPGKNGFKSEKMFRQTNVQHSDEYSTVLIQVNIIDVMIFRNFFTDIISRFAEPGENLICFFDVNGVLVWDDTAADQTVAEVLLKTMFRFLEVRPRAEKKNQFIFDSLPGVAIRETAENAKSLVARVYKDQNELYQNFWKLDSCKGFLDELALVADIAWVSQKATTSPADFFAEYDKSYEDIQSLHGSSVKDGIPDSWANVYNFLNEHGHTAVLNSFGADTARAVRRVMPDFGRVLHLTVNYDMWSKRDVDSWAKQFASEQCAGAVESDMTPVRKEDGTMTMRAVTSLPASGGN